MKGSCSPEQGFVTLLSCTYSTHWNWLYKAWLSSLLISNDACVDRCVRLIAMPRGVAWMATGLEIGCFQGVSAGWL